MSVCIIEIYTLSLALNSWVDFFLRNTTRRLKFVKNGHNINNAKIIYIFIGLIRLKEKRG